jgi:hypothetical protein
MPKRKIHFIGFLANVDDSILKLNLKDGFEFKKLPQKEVEPFLKKIEFHYGVDTSLQIIKSKPDGKASGPYCITKQSATVFKGTTQGGVTIKRGELKSFNNRIRDKIRLLRLFSEGNIVLWLSYFYHSKDSETLIISRGREGPIADKTIFSLKDKDISAAQSFLENTKIPFKESFIQLAFESFEKSYEIHERPLAFLSLMLSLESLFTKESQGRGYAIARNAAALLGETDEDSKEIFEIIRSFYHKRGELIHEGKIKKVRQEDILKLREYVRKSIKEVITIGKDKDKILDLLKSCGFGHRPWRKPG